ncbi:Eco57I restriction-modification methylase domain-containing protein [Bifidobacterium boum]|uniref:Eco57I restriction-modification methylase domain-containing protein n=1 Tax=Bifidobacterium boum TaxID=78343 RepID=UPI003F902BA4
MRTSAAEIRDHAAATLSPETQQRLEQFLTPAPVADQAASLFTPTRKPVRILDLGSGTGILAAAVAERSADGSSVVAVEQDANLAADSERTLSQVCHNTKVINASVFETLLDPVFDRVILNPPYKKISPIRIPTSAGDVKVTNQYTAFMVYAIQAMADGGECVAIIPRSWMNGEYFKDFRKWLLDECSIDAIAVYGSRQDHFKDMDILQEIMLLKLTKQAQRPDVLVYASATPSLPLDRQQAEHVPFNQLILGHDRIIRVQQQDPRLASFGTLSEQGLWVSTGKLVWFRNRDILSAQATPGSHPLYWSDNQAGLLTPHPVDCKREQWVTAQADARSVLLPAGSYCLVNRFSSKEQARRIHATYLRSDIGFVADNKLNYIHQGASRRTIPLPDDIARGLTLWLSTSIVDEWYRQISGSTQVNATDLRQLPCPNRSQLAQLAGKLPIEDDLDQERIDHATEGLFSWTTAS